MDSAEKKSNKCPECDNDILIKDKSRGDVVCNICGLVINQTIIDCGPERRAFTLKEFNERVRFGAPATLTISDKGLSTEIGRDYKDGFGNIIPPKKISELFRLRKQHIRTRTNKSIDRNLSKALNILDRVSSQLKLSKDNKESSALIYRKLVYRNLLKGRSIEAMMIASIYASCRMNDILITFDDFLEFTSITKKKIIVCYKLILKELKIYIRVPSPIDFIPKFSTELNLSVNTQNRANYILNLANKYNITAGKDPAGLAGAALYAAAIQEGERRSQKEISNTAGVTKATIRKGYKELIHYLNFIINTLWKKNIQRLY